MQYRDVLVVKKIELLKYFMFKKEYAEIMVSNLIPKFQITIILRVFKLYSLSKYSKYGIGK